MKITDVNSADISALQELEGISSGIAKAIIRGRPYICPNQLLDIPGISEELLTSLEMQGLWVDRKPKKAWGQSYQRFIYGGKNNGRCG